jgi:hypothetical protein
MILTSLHTFISGTLSVESLDEKRGGCGYCQATSSMHSGISVVDVCDNLVGPGGNDRAGVKFLAVGRCPGVKQAGEGIGFSVPHGNSHRLFPPVHLLPLVEAVGRDHASFTFKQSTKSWFLLQRFGAGVDHLVADLLVLCPRWNKAPTQFTDSAAPTVSKKASIPFY